MQEDEIKWLDKIESLSVQAIKDYILDNEKGLAIMLYNDIKSEIFQQNRGKKP